MVLSMDRWIGKVAIVTGASSGIGATIAEKLVEIGLQVVGLARRKERMEQLAEKLAGKKGKLYPIKTDLSKEEDILNAFKWVKENLGPIHILINNAALNKSTSLTDGDIEIWKNVFAVNVIGLCIATREAVRDMRANNVDGHIIHINSVVGDQNLSPGGVDTEMIGEFKETELYKKFVEAHEILEPEVIADGVIYALSTPPHVQIQQLTIRSVTESF
ncbi:hypothetical protein NQ314_014549 [Rhamnusium bicolor]|uniref:Farnesol dehydrogenase-like n=1 Tax=Rhamnusium bicolor TaxID=1586634 RepID=A0AAV8X128_9CUCU|nr:hypothetical protein NQ314_014549 [Rhamnusium bicolor]